MTQDVQQAYNEGYQLGYQHGFEAAAGSTTGYPFHLIGRHPARSSRLLMLLMPLKPLFLLPHLVILWLLSVAAVAVMLVAWFAVVLTGRYPRALWDFMVGYNRWNVRVQAWLMGLTDAYPPFSLD
ncbi:MAG: DUF4389 domain-containing protein [Symbiobacterium sp.]|uniref:DUF4389 domain-containing protein n=1 Tax=Symbiobacterium sp. TaxID=1971213 RepID=UPI00346471E3